MQLFSVALLATGTSIVAGKSFLSQRPLPTEALANVACSEHESGEFCAEVSNLEARDVASMTTADTAPTLSTPASVAPGAATATGVVLDVVDKDDEEDYNPFGCQNVGKPPVCHHPHHTRHYPPVITFKRDVATTTGAAAATTSTAVHQRDDSSAVGPFPDECYAIDRPGYCDEWTRIHGLPALPDSEKEDTAALKARSIAFVQANETPVAVARDARVPEMITHGLPMVMPTTLVTVIVREGEALTAPMI